MKRIKKVEAHLEEYSMGVLLIGITIILTLQIFMRMLKLSLSWPEELARYLYIWTVLLSIGYTIRNKTILRVDLLLNLLPRFLRRLTESFIQLLSAAFYAFMFYYAIFVMLKVKISGQTSPALELPMYLIYLIIPVGFALASLRSIQQLYWDLTGKTPEINPAQQEVLE